MARSKLACSDQESDFWAILMFCFCNTAICIDGVASLLEGKSRGLCLVQLCANTG